MCYRRDISTASDDHGTQTASAVAVFKFRAYEVALASRGIRHADEIEDLSFYAEAFYYFAWRFVATSASSEGTPDDRRGGVLPIVSSTM